MRSEVVQTRYQPIDILPRKRAQVKRQAGCAVCGVDLAYVCSQRRWGELRISVMALSHDSSQASRECSQGGDNCRVQGRVQRRAQRVRFQQRDLASGRHLIHRIPTVEAERHEVRSTSQFLQRLQDGVLSASWRRGVGRAAHDLQRTYFARTWGGNLANEV